MPKRDIAEFIAHLYAASPSEREILETLVTLECARMVDKQFTR